MLDKKDIALLREMFADVKHEMRDEFHSVVNAAVFASEERTNKRFDEVIQKIEHVESSLQNEINGTNAILLSFIEEVEPRIEKHEKKIVRIQRHVKLGSKVKV